MFHKLHSRIGIVLRSTAFRKDASGNVALMDDIVRRHLRSVNIEVAVVAVIPPHEKEARFTVTWQAKTGGDFEANYFLL